MRLLLTLALLFFGTFVAAQPYGGLGNVVFLQGTADPTGSCIIGTDFMRTDNNTRFSCTDGTWTQLSTGGVTFPLTGPDGSAAAPTYSYSNYPAAGSWIVGGFLVSQGNNVTGTDQVGGGNTMRAGQGTGTGSGGNVSWAVSPSGPTSGSTPNALQTVIFTGGQSGYVEIGGVDANAGFFTSQFRGVDRAAGNTDGVGGDVQIVGGVGTGSGKPGNVIFQTAVAGASGSTQQTPVTRATVSSDGLTLAAVTFANLPAAPNFSIIGCSDCAPNSSPCTGSSTGAIAKRLNGVWDCR